jgi:hypothetical protein
MSTLEDAVELIDAGDRQRAQRILAMLLSEDPANEAAWLWMSRIVERDEQRKDCLRQILKRNPEHPEARAALARLEEPEVAHEAPQSPDDLATPPTEAAEDESRQPGDVRDTEEEGGEARPSKQVEWQAPPPPARDPAMMADLADYVIAKLGKQESLDNIVLKVCEVTAMSWSEASDFVQRVEEERRPEIASRRRPILLLLGAVGLLIGGYMAYNGASYLAAFAASIDGFSENPLFYLLDTPQLARRLITLVIGTAIVVGSLVGIARALLPAGDRSLLSEGSEGQATGSIDDLFGVHVSLGGQGASAARRRRGGR